MKKEKIILFRNRPLAAVSATDLNMERHGTIIDELLAHKLGFVICDLQYTWITLATNKKTRVCGRIRSTVQLLSKNLPGGSLSLNARVVRDLTSLTGVELIADEKFFKKLSGNFTKEERDSPTSGSLTTGAANNSTTIQTTEFPVPNMVTTLPNVRGPHCHEGDSSFDDKFDYSSSDHSSERNCSDCYVDSSCSSENKTEPHNHMSRCAPHNEAYIERVRGRRSKLLQEASVFINSSFGEYEDNYVSSDRSSERDCSDCYIDSSCTSEDKDEPHNHKSRCAPHSEAHIGRVKGRKSKALQEASAKVTEEEVEALRMRRSKFQQSPDSFLDEYFPGGSALAHHLSDRWEKEKQEKAKQLQQEQAKAKRLQELPSKIQAAMMKKKRKKK